MFLKNIPAPVREFESYLNFEFFNVKLLNAFQKMKYFDCLIFLLNVLFRNDILRRHFRTRTML